MTEVIEKQSKSLLEDYDYEQKVRLLDLKERIYWFMTHKKQMSQNEKWEAFYDIHDDYDVDVEVLKRLINSLIRKKGLSVWE
jgi:hypothetical protein